MKKLWVLVLIAVCALLISAKNDNEEKKEKITFQNIPWGYQISYPSGWILQKSDSRTGYISLFSPETLDSSTEQNSYELLSGIKIEIISDMTEDDYNTLIAGDTIKLETVTLQDKNIKIISKQYLFADEQSLIIIIPFKTHVGKTVFIAYIPEQDKISYYRQQLNQIVLSFQKIKSG